MRAIYCIVLYICVHLYFQLNVLATQFYPINYSIQKNGNGIQWHFDKENHLIYRLFASSILGKSNNMISISNNLLSVDGQLLMLPSAPQDIISVHKNTFLVSTNGNLPRLFLCDIKGNILKSELLPKQSIIDATKWISIDTTTGKALLVYGNNLLSIDINTLQHTIISQQVLTVEPYPLGAYLLIKAGGGVILQKVTCNGNILFEFPFSSLGTTYRIQHINDHVLVLGNASSSASSGFVYSIKNGKQNMVFLPCIPQLCCLREDDQHAIQLAWIEENEAGQFSFVVSNLNGNPKKSQLPEECLSPISLSISDNVIYALFSNHICTIDMKSEAFSLIAASRLGKMRVFEGSIPQIIQIDNQLLISSQSDYMIVSKSEDYFWWIKTIASNSIWYIVFISASILLYYLFRGYARQKRFLSASMELSGIGLILGIDAKGMLNRTNATARNILHITADIPLHQHIRFYCQKPGFHNVLSFIEDALLLQTPIHQKIHIESQNGDQEMIWSATPLISISGNFSGLILTGFDITEELERKRLTNWAQLSHDMQTNLSIILLNAQQINVEHSKPDQERKKKILLQSSLLMQRVRDILSVGRDEEPNISQNDALVLCRNVIIEFDDALFPNVKLLSNGKNIIFECDPIKLTRALRNAVENGIRALQKKEGIVELSCSHDKENVYFTITDNGIGMDNITRENMMKPYFTTKKSLGGYGIGTMIMQKVAELHHGSISVKSEQGKGSSIIFSIPREYKKQ